MFTPPPSPSPAHSFNEQQRTPVPQEATANEPYDPNYTDNHQIAQQLQQQLHKKPPTLLAPPPITLTKVASKSSRPVSLVLNDFPSSKHSPQASTMKDSSQAQQSRKKAIGRRIKLLAILVPTSLILLAFACSHSVSRLSFLTDMFALRRMRQPTSTHDFDPSRPELVEVETVHRAIYGRDTGGAHNVNRWINQHWSERLHSRHHRRQGLDLSSSSTAGSSTSAPTPTSTATPTIPDPSSPPPLPTPFPQPFDSSVGFSWSSRSCQVFFETFTKNITFRECRPFGMLLSSSTAFFNQAQDNLTALNIAIWGTCNTDPTVETCVGIMDWHAQQIQTVCQRDLADGNKFAEEALNGFVSYRPFYEAGCLPNLRTNSYCYVEALTASTPADLYYYALPLGTPVPNRTVPSCSSCIKGVLNIYSQYATNSSLLLSRTYNPAAERAIEQCGETYAVLTGSGSNSALVLQPASLWIWALSLVVASLFSLSVMDN